MPLMVSQALRLAAASQLLVVAALLLRDHRRSRVTAATALFVGCVVCYLASPALLQPGVPRVAAQFAAIGALAVPFAFWLTARLYFDDSFQPSPFHGVVLVGVLVARALVLPWPIAASGIAAVAVVDALRRIHQGGGSDLLLSRLRLRYVILLGTGLYALVVLVAEAVVRPGSPADRPLNAANDVSLFILVEAISTTVLRIEPELVRAGAKRAGTSDPPTILVTRLEQLIEDQQVFRTAGLTISALADRLGEHEYKIRQLINARLGFRNFGAFLNHYRVREARKVLADPGQKEVGVAEIAYRYGYSSLGPFNRAFKEIVGQTPTEYRKAALERENVADSEIGAPLSKRS
jgi:AraC-like DNA-binding protein